MRKPGCPQLRVSELRLARLPEKVLQSPGLKVKAWLFHVYKLNAGGLRDGLNVQCCTQSPGFAAVAPPSMEISLSRQKKKILLLSPGLVVVEIWESDYFKNQLSTSPHLSLSDAPSPTSSRQYPPLSCGSHVHWVGFYLPLLPNHQFSHPSAFQVTKFCSYCLLSSSSFPLGLKTFKNHFRIILWGTWQGVKAFNLPSLHRNLQIPSAFCLTTLLPRNQSPSPCSVPLLCLPLTALCSSHHACGHGRGWDRTTNLFLSFPLNFYSGEIIFPIPGRKIGRSPRCPTYSHERLCSVIT